MHLTLIGDNGTGERYADVMVFIREQELEKDITVLGLLPPDQLVQELRCHDITVVPMVTGALPNKVFDSIATGLPIISLGIGDCSTIIKRYDLGWTASFNLESVSGILNKLTHESIREKSENILKHRSKYMHRNLFNEYERVILEVS